MVSWLHTSINKLQFLIVKSLFSYVTPILIISISTAIVRFIIIVSEQLSMLNKDIINRFLFFASRNIKKFRCLPPHVRGI